MAAWLLAAAFSALAVAAPSGRALFDAEGCAACHRIAGRGGNAGPDLTLVGFRHGPGWLDLWLSSPHVWKSDTQMPEFRLRAPERQALVSYLASLTTPDFRDGPPLDGKALFARAGCAACHGAQGRGGHPNNNVPGGLIPALTGAAQGYTAAELTRKISEGARPEKADPSGQAPMVAMPAWGQLLTPAEIDALAGYVLSLAPKDRKEDF